MGQFNDIIILGEDKSKSKDKGGGINAILALMKEMGSFREAVVDCKEAQAIEQNKTKIGEFEVKLDEMYDVLIEMARTGWKSVREQNVLAPTPEVKKAEPSPSTIVKPPTAPSM